MTYFLMLFFVFITLFFISMRWMLESEAAQRGWGLLAALAFVWAALGTHFVHNIM